MQNAQHQNLVGFIWNIANKLRGPYRPPQYRRVMLPLIVLRRFDLVLAENKQKVLAEKKRLEDKGITGPALEKALSRIAAADHKQELFNQDRKDYRLVLVTCTGWTGSEYTSNIIVFADELGVRNKPAAD